MVGVPLPFVEIRVRAGDEDVPWDGEAMGELEVRGPWVAAAYYDAPESADRWTEDGWFRTGDIVSIHPRGFIQIKDRSKDVIKSGGEWISSVELENALMAHPAVAESAVIAVPDDKWGERPLAAVVLREGASATADELREFLAPSFAKWWLPERIEFVDEIPKTSVGKFRKTALREQFASKASRAGADELKAAVLPAVDAPFELREVDDPVPQDGEALVRVRAAGINFLDVLIRRGRYPQMPEFPAVLGVELAGELEDGTRVMAMVPAGAYAELAAVPRASLVPLPDGASFAEGAGFILTFLTAYVPLTRQVRFEEERTVLVHAAAGGVGCAAIQVARALNARVVAAVGSPEKLELCRELGAEEAYVYDELPDDLRVDVVMDPVGGELFEAALGRLRPLGQLVAIGYAGGLWPELQPAHVVGRNVGVQGVYIGRLLRHAPDVIAAATRELLELWSWRRIRPVVGAEFPLAEVEQAHELVESRRSVGKVVLVP